MIVALLLILLAGIALAALLLIGPAIESWRAERRRRRRGGMLK